MKLPQLWHLDFVKRSAESCRVLDSGDFRLKTSPLFMQKKNILCLFVCFFACNRSRIDIANMYWEGLKKTFWFNSSRVPTKNSIFPCFVIIAVVFLKSELSIPMPLDITISRGEGVLSAGTLFEEPNLQFLFCSIMYSWFNFKKS